MQSTFFGTFKNDILADSPPIITENRLHIRKLTFESPALTRTTEASDDFQIDWNNAFSQSTNISSAFSSQSSKCSKQLCFDFADNTDNSGVSTNFQGFFSQPAAETKSYDPLELPDDFSENTQMLLEEEEDTVESPTLRNQRRYTTDERDDDFPSLMMRKAGRCISNPIFPSNFGESFDLTRVLTTSCSQGTETNKLPQKQEPVLPLSRNLRDPDLWTISPETLVNLMNDPTKRYLVIDCRYDYEYKGGHIKDAINIDALETLERLFLSHRELLCDDYYLNQIKYDLKNLLLTSHLIEPLNNLNSNSSEPPILIFHCEFSQKRGPRALRALRNLDRQLNAHRWPGLYYPQVYLLEEGYQNFHQQFPEYCTPESYVRMIDKNYRKEYAEAREKERKTWKKSQALKPTLGSNKNYIQRARTFSMFSSKYCKGHIQK